MLVLCVFLVYAMVTNPASTGNVLEAMLVCMTTILGIYSLAKGGLTGFELLSNKDLKEDEKTEKKKRMKELVIGGVIMLVATVLLVSVFQMMGFTAVVLS